LRPSIRNSHAHLCDAAVLLLPSRRSPPAFGLPCLPDVLCWLPDVDAACPRIATASTHCLPRLHRCCRCPP
jgi:hypothetical protein